jgi:hypothetical protein
MTTEEQRLSELLKRSVPEPPFELSADRVTVPHVDRPRRSWLMPALAAASVVLVAAAGVGLHAMQHPSPASPSASSAQRKAQGTPTPTSTATAVMAGPAEAPASFNPLVLPVNFGWLPAGFSENQPSPDEFPTSRGPLGVTPTQVNFGASTSNGEGLAVTVAARGVSVNPWNSGPAENPGEMTVTGTAPDINGRPAKWLGGGLEWEYANGGWATLITGGETSKQAQAGWGHYCTMDIPKGSSTSVANPGQTCTAYAPQSAALRAELEKIASSLTWTAQRFTFPYQFTKALPRGWTVGNVTGNFVNGRLTAGDLYLDPVTSSGRLDTDDALDIQAYTASNTRTYCGAIPGAYFATYNGVKWQIEQYYHGDNSSAMGCSGTPMNSSRGGSVSVGFDANTVHGDPLGTAGVKVILLLLKFFGPNPANWTTNPFVN